MNEFTQEELNLLREWFNAVKDLNPKYLESMDYVLYKKILSSIKDWQRGEDE